MPKRFLDKMNASKFRRTDETHTSVIKQLIKADWAISNYLPGFKVQRGCLRGMENGKEGTYLYREEKEGAREFQTNVPNFDK